MRELGLLLYYRLKNFITNFNSLLSWFNLVKAVSKLANLEIRYYNSVNCFEKLTDFKIKIIM